MSFGLTLDSHSSPLLENAKREQPKAPEKPIPPEKQPYQVTFEM